jgi:hypothetical protein
VYNTDLDNRELVIVVAIINYNKRRVPAYIIIKGAYYLRGYFLLTLDNSIEFSRLPTSYTNNRLGIKYL